MFGIPLHILAGGAAAALLILHGLKPAIVEARRAVQFLTFKARVRILWREHVDADEPDIIAKTGEDDWLDAFEAGQTPWEAVHGGVRV